MPKYALSIWVSFYRKNWALSSYVYCFLKFTQATEETNASKQETKQHGNTFWKYVFLQIVISLGFLALSNGMYFLSELRLFTKHSLEKIISSPRCLNEKDCSAALRDRFLQDHSCFEKNDELLLKNAEKCSNKPKYARNTQNMPNMLFQIGLIRSEILWFVEIFSIDAIWSGTEKHAKA